MSLDLQFPRPRHRRVRAEGQPLSPPPPPPPPSINVIGVSTDDPPSAGLCLWLFDQPVTLDGSAVVGLQVQIAGLWTNPSSAYAGGVDAIWTMYATGETLDGKSFRIIAPPGGIVQASEIVLPQEGMVMAP